MRGNVLVRGIWKKPFVSIKTNSNLSGLVAMPKLFDTRKKQLFLSPVKDCFTQDTVPIHSLPLNIPTPQIAERIPQTTISHVPLTTKEREAKNNIRGYRIYHGASRVAKIGKALELGQMDQNSNKINNFFMNI